MGLPKCHNAIVPIAQFVQIEQLALWHLGDLKCNRILVFFPLLQIQILQICTKANSGWCP